VAKAQALIQNLDQLVTVYRHLLEAVRRENECLLTARSAELANINETKEKLVNKVRELDIQWQTAADELGGQLGLSSAKPRLMELAIAVNGEERTKLEQIHSVLNMLVQRISELNKKNEVLVQAALVHIAGAMGSITQTLNENPTYGNRGGMAAENKQAQGRLVQRQV
jgi:flagellar biosynthesis/type III secretory pathway chaperone